MLEERCSDAEIKLETAEKENAARQKELDLLTKELHESESKVLELTKQKDAVSEEVVKHEQVKKKKTCLSTRCFDLLILTSTSVTESEETRRETTLLKWIRRDRKNCGREPKK